MKTPKIIFFDIDETLFAHRTRTVPASAIAALEKLKARGIRCAIASGRSPCVFPAQIQELRRAGLLEVAIAINGQYCLDGDRVLRDHPIPSADVEALLTIARAAGFDYGFITPTEMVMSAASDRVREALRNIGPYRIDPEHHRRAPVYQLLVFVDSAEEEALQPGIGLGYKSVRWHPLAVDWLASASSKALGIAAVCAELGVSAADCLAFGDGLNDLEMAAAVGYFVAMGNGHPDLLARADFIAPAAADDGIARALEQLEIL